MPDEVCVGTIFSFGPHDFVRSDASLERRYPQAGFRYKSADTGNDIVALMRGERIDIAALGSVPAAQFILEGLPYKIFYISQLIGDDEGLIVRSGMTAEDLPGKAIATPYISTAHFSLVRYLMTLGIRDQVEIKVLSPTETIRAWDSGEIDGAYIWGDFLVRLEKTGQRLIDSQYLRSEGIITSMVCAVRTGFWKEYPHIVKSYVRALDKGVHALRRDPRMAAAIMKRSTESTLQTDSWMRAINDGNYFTLAEQRTGEDSRYLLGNSGGFSPLAASLYEAAWFLHEVGAFSGSVPDAARFEGALLEI